MEKERQINDAFLSFMVYYMHGASAITLILSLFVVYLMLTRTPRSSRQLVKHLIIVQVLITFNDLILCVLLCGIPLFPLPAGFCEGLICLIGLPGHVGSVLMFFGLAYVAVAIVFCFHSKHNTVVELTKYRKIPPALFRITTLILVSVPCVLFIFTHSAMGDGRKYIEQEFPSYAWIFTTNRTVLAYSFSSHLPLVIAVFTTAALVKFTPNVTIRAMCLVVFLCAFFIAHTFHLLSRYSLLISGKTRKLQGQLTINLTMQMTLPLTVQIGPLTFYGLAIITGTFTPVVTNIMFCIQLLHATLHSSLIIATTPSYRNAILRPSRSSKDLSKNKRTVENVRVTI